MWSRFEQRDRGRATHTRVSRMSAFVQRRLSRHSVVGRRLAIAIVSSAVLLIGFATLATVVAKDSAPTALDASAIRFVSAHRTTGDVMRCGALSRLGDPVAMWLLSVGIALALLARRQWAVASMWTVTVTGGGLLNVLIKRSMHRPRPLGALGLLHNASWSFPSGHTMGAIIVFGMLAFLLVDRGQRRLASVAVVMTAASIVVLVGLSRVCLGVHYVTDVIGAIAAGGMWLAACIALYFATAHRHGASRSSAAR